MVLQTNKIPEYVKQHPIALTITVVGAGGTGSLFLYALARICYAYRALTKKKIHVIVMDGESVELHNIGRQLYSSGECGNNKAALTVSRINRTYGFSWIAYPKHLEFGKVKLEEVKNSKELQTYITGFSSNIIVTCTDSVESRRQVKYMRDFMHKLYTQSNPSLAEELIPYFWIDLGNEKHHGQLVVGSHQMGWPDIIDQYGRYYQKKKVDEPSCSLAMSLNQQDLMINPFMADIGAKWLWDMLTHNEINWRGAFVNLETLQINKIKVNANRKDAPVQEYKGGKSRNSRSRRSNPALSEAGRPN